SDRQVRQLAELINQAVEAPDELENAVSTCFLEHLRQVRTYKVLAPHLSTQAKRRTHACHRAGASPMARVLWLRPLQGSVGYTGQSTSTCLKTGPLRPQPAALAVRSGCIPWEAAPTSAPRGRPCFESRVWSRCTPARSPPC